MLIIQFTALNEQNCISSLIVIIQFIWFSLHCRCRIKKIIHLTINRKYSFI